MMGLLILLRRNARLNFETLLTITTFVDFVTLLTCDRSLLSRDWPIYTERHFVMSAIT